MHGLSVVIITRDEAVNIADCVASARFADEVIVLDSGSTDGTQALARQAGATVVETDWPGFGEQKNRALEMAGRDWIFVLDADERITPELAEEIRRVIRDDTHAGWEVPRRSLFVTRFMRHGGWWPDRTCRLVRRGRGRFSPNRVHEVLRVDGPVGRLENPLLHYSYRDLGSVLQKIDRYSSASALDLRDRGRRGSLGGAIGHGFFAFVRTYLLRLGFLDGAEGFMLAVMNAEASYYKHLKLWCIDRSPPPPPRS